tara:strand:- start:941 stop:1189 length:249 start_codon:yes stop_codon:yes gene_type:complete
MTDDDVPVILEDLTAQQVEMLNKIWSFENAEQLQRFRDTLPIFRKQELDTLVQLIIMEIEGIRAESDQSLAQEMLKNIGLNV